MIVDHGHVPVFLRHLDGVLEQDGRIGGLASVEGSQDHAVVVTIGRLLPGEILATQGGRFVPFSFDELVHSVNTCLLDSSSGRCGSR